MSEPIRKQPIPNPESYSPKTPRLLSLMEAFCAEKVIDTVVVEGVEFQIIEKGPTLYAGAYAVEPENLSEVALEDCDTDTKLLFKGRNLEDEIKAIRNSVTPDRTIALNIDYTVADRPCAMLYGQETTTREQPEGIHVIEAEPTLLIKVGHTHAAFDLTKKLTGRYIHQYQISELFDLIKHIFCEGEQAEFEYNGDNGSGNADAEHHLIIKEGVGYIGSGFVTVPVKRRAVASGGRIRAFQDGDKSPAIAPPIVPRIERDVQAARPALREFRKMTFGGRDWLVLNERDGAALIMSETVLYRRFHPTETEVTWADSELREYLNGEFYDAFREEEKARILVTTLPPCYANPWHGPGGNKARIIQIMEQDKPLQAAIAQCTDDRIFLLSIEELIQYTGDSGDLERRIGWYWDGKTWEPEKNQGGMVFQDGFGQFLFDPYSPARIAKNEKGEASWWRLRSPGYQYIYTVVVSPIGAVIFTGTPHTENGIRPAMWVKT